jgi:hypothetical protein
MNFIAKKKGTQRDHLEASEWNTAHTATNQTGTNNGPKIMQRNPTKEAYSTTYLFFEEALLLCVSPPNTLKQFVLDAYEHIGLQILVMHDPLRNLLHINGHVLNSVGAWIWLMAYNSCKGHFRWGSQTKKWQIKAKFTWHHFGGKINWFEPQKKKGELIICITKLKDSNLNLLSGPTQGFNQWWNLANHK